MKTSILYFALFTCLLTTACKKNKDGDSTMLQATIDGKVLNLNNVTAKLQEVDPSIQNRLQIQGLIDGDANKLVYLDIAVNYVSKGDKIDLGLADGLALLYYVTGPSAHYGAGFGAAGTGTVTITTNDKEKRKLEGTFSGTLINAFDTNQKVTCTNGKFSVNY